MVRPVARFRPGARRSDAAGLVPVFAVDVLLSNRIEVWTGSGGLIATVDPENDVARSYAPTTLLGLDQVIVDYLEAGGNVAIEDRQQAFSQQSRIFRVREEVVNGLYVVSFLRAHWVTHTYSVYWRTSLPGIGPVGVQVLYRLQSVFAAVYDLVTVAVNLETGVKEAKSSPVYTFNGNVTGYVPGIDNLQYESTASVSIYTTSRAIRDTLPDAHPLKSCDPSIFGDADNTAGTLYGGVTENGKVSTGSYSFTSYPEDAWTQDYRFAQTFAVGHHAKKVVSLGGLRGLNTVTGQRVYDFSPNFQLLEYGTYSLQDAALCNVAPEIGVMWSGSPEIYANSVLTEREEVFTELEAMNEADQNSFLLSTQPAPLSLGQDPDTVASIDEATYFLQADVMVTTPGQLSFDFSRTRRLLYWIKD